MANHRQMRVLLVEDDPSLASSLRRALEAQKFAVTAVGDGENGFGDIDWLESFGKQLGSGFDGAFFENFGID